MPPKTAASSGRTLGDANAPVTVVEYADFQCPICKAAETSVISRLEQDYVQQGKVKIEFRDYAFIGQDSWNAAQAALAANDQGKFWQYHDALFNAQGQENSGQFSYDNLVKIAQQVGLDVPTFEQTLEQQQPPRGGTAGGRSGVQSRRELNADLLHRRHEDRREPTVQPVSVGD